jgi:hypothetical protein
MKWQQGQSGNPAGRPLGSRNKSTVLMQNLLDGEAEAIGRKVIEMAKGGDMAAIRVCMDRLAPARRGAAIFCELPPVGTRGGAVAAMAAIIGAAPAEAARNSSNASRQGWPRREPRRAGRGCGPCKQQA